MNKHLEKVQIFTDAEWTVSHGKLLISEPARKTIYDKKEQIEKALIKYEGIGYFIDLFYNAGPNTYSINGIKASEDALIEITAIVNNCLYNG